MQLDFSLDEEAGRAGAKRRKPEKREIIFVLDCSGSMMGDSISQAKKALEICLRALEPGTAFNVYRFGSTFESMFEKPVTYDKKTLKKALGYLRHVDADLGGTEILSPLQHVYEHNLTRGCGSREIILITDGMVANEENVFKLIRAGQPETRVFSIGIGAGPNDHLIKGIARAGFGASEFIYPGERIEPKMMAIFSKVTEPRLMDTVVSWGSKDSEQAPGELLIFGGSPVTVWARLEAGGKTAGKKAGKKAGKVTVKARLGGKSRKWDLEVVEVKSPGLPIPALWARERIRDLDGSGGEAAGRGSRQTERKAGMIRDAIISLSRKYGVLSSLTSYIAIEKRKDKDKATGEIVLRKVPALLTSGWHGIGSVMQSLPGGMYHDASGADVPRSIVRAYIDVPSVTGRKHLRQDLKLRLKSSMSQKLIMGPKAGIDATATAILTGIFSLQDAEGSFNLTPTVAGLLGIKIADLKAAAKKIKADSEVDGFRVLSTAVILKVLEAHFPAQMARYGGLVKKSRQWLSGQIDSAAPRIGRQALMDWVKAFVEKKVQINMP
jgi:Ca-activated chloride channel family protein